MEKLVKDKNAWGLDTYLAKQIAEGTKKHLVWNRANDAGSHPTEITWEEWNEILRKINAAFWKYHTREEKDTFKDIHEEIAWINGDEWREAKELFVKWFEHLWY